MEELMVALLNTLMVWSDMLFHTSRKAAAIEMFVQTVDQKKLRVK